MTSKHAAVWPQRYVLQIMSCTVEQTVHNHDATKQQIAEHARQAEVTILRVCLGVCTSQATVWTLLRHADS